MTELFVSYCRDDTAVMEPIVENLRQLGFDLWIDIEHLPPGTPAWTRAIDDALLRADGVLAFLSPAAKDSLWCNIETQRAQMFDKPVYPILVSGEPRTAIPIHLTGVQFADMRGRANREKSFDRLVKTLSDELAHPVPEFDLQPGKSGMPVITNINHVPEHVEGNVYALNVAGDVNVADILPGPFEWCEIPAGRVTLEGDAGTFDVQPFFLAKYQTTYEQFQVFIDAEDGFTNDAWWQGLAKRESETGSQYFTHTKNLPRENVSWYDAVAFCRWLSSRVGYEARLPTEGEWQWAAQGPGDWAYPWGNEYVKGYANINEEKSGIRDGVYLGKTTPVGSYPKGASSYGVLDMSGNVWEWCLNEYYNLKNSSLGGSEDRALRGGSFFLNQNDARASYRLRSRPDIRYLNLGFRVARSYLNK